MPGFHRVGDARTCGGTTVGGAATVFINGMPVALEGDGYTFGGGNLTASNTSNIFVEGRRVVLQGSTAAPGNPAYANPSNPAHWNPAAAGGSPNVFGHG